MKSHKSQMNGEKRIISQNHQLPPLVGATNPGYISGIVGRLVLGVEYVLARDSPGLDGIVLPPTVSKPPPILGLWWTL
jgi:hypothetical protein